MHATTLDRSPGADATDTAPVTPLRPSATPTQKPTPTPTQTQTPPPTPTQTQSPPPAQTPPTPPGRAPRDLGHRASSARTPREERRRLETLELYAAAARAGTADDERDRRRLVAHVVERHLDVADAVARRYASSGDEHADIRQVACVGLVKAALRFDHGKGDDFVAFAGPTVSGEIKRHLRDTGWSVRPPRRLQELCAAAVVARASLEQQLGREPSEHELAEHLGQPVAEVREALLARRDRWAASLDVPVGDGDGTSLGDLVTADDELPRAEARCELRRVLPTLGRRDRLLVQLRFVDELSQADIGRVLGVTQMQVSRLLAKLLARLRRELGEDRELGEGDAPGRAAAASPRDVPRPLSA